MPDRGIPLSQPRICNLGRMDFARASRGVAVLVLLTALLCVAMGPQTPPPKNPAVNQDSLVVGDFEARVKDYVKLRKKAEAGLPALKPTDSPHQINERRRLLASRIQAAREQAKQGDIFSSEVSQLFKRLISMAYQASGSSKVGASLRHGEPVHEVPVRVNALYPENIPLQTTPPSILLNLPQLPPELDYRIVGQDLVLRDTGANLIVDFIPGVIPRS
jgi:hypothetical protein